MPQAAAPPASPPPQTADELWQRLLERVGNSIAWSWLRSFEPAELDERTLKLVAHPGEKHMLSFASEARRKELTQMVGSILARPVKVELAAADVTADKPAPKSPAMRTLTQEQRREALQLPLVREVVDLFEASVTDVIREPEPETPSEPAESDTNDV